MASSRAREWRKTTWIAESVLLSLVFVGAHACTLVDPQHSHIDANVPPAPDFRRFLQRDLINYFAQQRDQKSVSIEYELLRDAPTQSGAAYPKYYLWVRVAGGKTVDDRGAVRAEAVERTHFDITDFVSERKIQTAPQLLNHVFPIPVCDSIKAKQQFN